MIYADELIRDPLGANAFLAKFFELEDVTNEVAHQVLADAQFNEIGLI